MLSMIRRWLIWNFGAHDWRVRHHEGAWALEADWGAGWRPHAAYATLIEASAAGRLAFPNRI